MLFIQCAYESSKINCYAFIPLNVQVIEKNFLYESCFISKTITKIFKKSQFQSHKAYK